MTGIELDKLERDLRTLFPVTVSLAERERWPREALVDRLVKLVVTCVKTSSGK